MGIADNSLEEGQHRRVDRHEDDDAHDDDADLQGRREQTERDDEGRGTGRGVVRVGGYHRPTRQDDREKAAGRETKPVEREPRRRGRQHHAVGEQRVGDQPRDAPDEVAPDDGSLGPLDSAFEREDERRRTETREDDGWPLAHAMSPRTANRNPA
jgi:hypothetical protein